MSDCFAFSGSWSCDSAFFSSDFSDDWGTLATCIKGQFQQVIESCCNDALCDCCCPTPVVQCTFYCGTCTGTANPYGFDEYCWKLYGAGGVCIENEGSCVAPYDYYSYLYYCYSSYQYGDYYYVDCYYGPTLWVGEPHEATTPPVEEAPFYVNEPGKIKVNRTEIVRRIKERAAKLRGFAYPS